MDSANEQYFNVVESACFVINLDDGSPQTPEERVRQGYLGDGFNRWFDKVLQFPVGANGRSSFFAEHGIVDGLACVRLCEWIGAAIASYTPSDNTSSYDLAVQLEELALETTPAIDSHIDVLRQRFARATEPHLYRQIQLDDFGMDFLLESKMPPKQVIDITFQLALRLFFGYSPASWEVLTMGQYHRGRTEYMQTAVPAVVAFCEAAVSATDHKHMTPAALRGPLLEAVKRT
jgi:hypothetical protein